MAGDTLDITEARKQISTVDERLVSEHVIYVTKRSKKVFAMVNLDFLQTVLETIEIMSDPESFRMFKESLEDIRRGRLVDHEDLKQELGL